MPNVYHRWISKKGLCWVTASTAEVAVCTKSAVAKVGSLLEIDSPGRGEMQHDLWATLGPAHLVGIGFWYDDIYLMRSFRHGFTTGLPWMHLSLA